MNDSVVSLQNPHQAHLTQFVHERLQLDPHGTSLGLHQGNELWHVEVKFGQESPLQGICSQSPELLLDLK